MNDLDDSEARGARREARYNLRASKKHSNHDELVRVFFRDV